MSDLARIRQQLESIVVTVGEDKGVILVSDASPTHYSAELGGQVYDHEYFSPLGGALIELWEMVCELEAKS